MAYERLVPKKKFRYKNTKKLKAFRKENCERCGVPKNNINILMVHHIDHNPQNDASSNLITVCRDCHLEIHREKNKLKGPVLTYVERRALLNKKS